MKNKFWLNFLNEEQLGILQLSGKIDILDIPIKKRVCSHRYYIFGFRLARGYQDIEMYNHILSVLRFDIAAMPISAKYLMRLYENRVKERIEIFKL